MVALCGPLERPYEDDVEALEGVYRRGRDQELLLLLGWPIPFFAGQADVLDSAGVKS